MNPNRRRRTRRISSLRPQVDVLESRWLLAAEAPVLVGTPVAGSPEAVLAPRPGSAPLVDDPAPVRSPTQTHHRGTSHGPAHPTHHRHHQAAGTGSHSGADDDGASPFDQDTPEAHAEAIRSPKPKIGQVHPVAPSGQGQSSRRGRDSAHPAQPAGPARAKAQPTGIGMQAGRTLPIRTTAATAIVPRGLAKPGPFHDDPNEEMRNFENSPGAKAKRMHKPIASRFGPGHHKAGGDDDQPETDDDRDNREDAPGREAEGQPQSTVGMDSHQIGGDLSHHETEGDKPAPQEILDAPADSPMPISGPSGGGTPAAGRAESPSPAGQRPAGRNGVDSGEPE